MATWKNIRTAMNRGAFDFLTKPIDFHDVEITISKTLQYVRQLREEPPRRRVSHRQGSGGRELSPAAELESLRDSLTHMIVHDLRTRSPRSSAAWNP